jgi:hypothetical protein
MHPVAGASFRGYFRTRGLESLRCAKLYWNRSRCQLRSGFAVHRPTDALRTLFSSGMDALFLGSDLVETAN